MWRVTIIFVYDLVPIKLLKLASVWCCAQLHPACQCIAQLYPIANRLWASMPTHSIYLYFVVFTTTFSKTMFLKQCLVACHDLWGLNTAIMISLHKHMLGRKNNCGILVHYPEGSSVKTFLAVTTGMLIAFATITALNTNQHCTAQKPLLLRSDSLLLSVWSKYICS